MKRCIPSLPFATCVAGLSAAAAQAPRPTPATSSDSGRKDYTAADVRFMSGMIYHHAQAILVAGWAPSHEAGPSVRNLCQRTEAANTDEDARLARPRPCAHETRPQPPGALLIP